MTWLAIISRRSKRRYPSSNSSKTPPFAVDSLSHETWSIYDKVQSGRDAGPLAFKKAKIIARELSSDVISYWSVIDFNSTTVTAEVMN